jgi:hypothetical protein
VLGSEVGDIEGEVFESGGGEGAAGSFGEDEALVVGGFDFEGDVASGGGGGVGFPVEAELVDADWAEEDAVGDEGGEEAGGGRRGFWGLGWGRGLVWEF